MKKITDFIVEKRYLILVVFIFFAILSVFMMKRVNINYDMAEYLPDSSGVKTGMDIMGNEFDSADTSILNLMFKGLDDEEKTNIYNELIKIEGISDVEYDNSSEHNKDDYTLYIITVDGADDSVVASNVYDSVNDKYKDYDIYTSGSVSERNSPVMPTWIMVLAVACATVILIVMSSSYVEPFLFLTVILLAVLLNNGTNIMFSSVSNITSSISAILQMALSMDYSIMLMNRYSQEKNRDKDKVSAMKKALYNSFLSISSSSVTTIVGLLALVFMSFTIGRDLGFVLAKGVLFSLITIFLCLPALILMFDRWITKTNKKSFEIRLDKLGKFSYKQRSIALILIIIAFGVSYLFKGNLGILYTANEDDMINSVFKENNQMALVYKNEYEDKIKDYCKKLSKDKSVDNVLCYGNTIGEDLTYDNLSKRIEDMGSSISVDDYLLRIIYYKYNTNVNNTKMSFDEFVSFIEKEVLSNEDVSSKIDNEVKNNVGNLGNFSNSSNIFRPRSSREIASIMGLDKSDVDNLMIYYNSRKTNTKMDIGTFIQFMNNYVLTDSIYSNGIDSNARESLGTLAKFTDKNIITKKMTSDEMANFLGNDKNLVASLYSYYLINSDINMRMSVREFVTFVNSDVLTNSEYSSSINDSMKSNIQLLGVFSDKDIVTKEMSSREIANLFGIDEDSVKMLLLSYYSNKDNNKTFTLVEFINYVNYLEKNTDYLNGVDLSNLDNLAIFAKNDDNINTTNMNKDSLKSIFSSELVDMVYMGLGIDSAYMMTPQEFVNLVLNNFYDMMDTQTRNSLVVLNSIIDDSVNGNYTRYSAKDISNLLDVDYNDIVSIYSLIDYISGNTDDWVISPYNFTLFIISGNDPRITATIDSNTLSRLVLLKNIMEASINNSTYSYQELANLIPIPENNIKQIYALYSSKYSMFKLSPEEFVSFILNHKDDSVLSNNMSKGTISSLGITRTVMSSTINGYQYGADDIAKLLSMSSDDMRLLYSLYDYKCLGVSDKLSLKDFVDFILNDVMNNNNFSSNFDESIKGKLNTIDKIMDDSVNGVKYNSKDMYSILKDLTSNMDENMIKLMYIYYGSVNNYDNCWKLSVEDFVNYLGDYIVKDELFSDFIDDDIRSNIKSARKDINSAKKMFIGNNYSRVIINTKLDPESNVTFNFIDEIKDTLGTDNKDIYLIGNSAMAREMSESFSSELDFITILTMVAIFIVVAITFKSFIIPLILTLLIQCAVYITMGILSLLGGDVYFIALLIVQSILMGATIDYAILYTSYYLESRNTMDVRESLINAYNRSIHTILTSSSILIIVTLIVGCFATAIAAKICRTLSLGTFCSVILILFILPAVLAKCDKFICKNIL